MLSGNVTFYRRASSVTVWIKHSVSIAYHSLATAHRAKHADTCARLRCASALMTLLIIDDSVSSCHLAFAAPSTTMPARYTTSLHRTVITVLPLTLYLLQLITIHKVSHLARERLFVGKGSDNSRPRPTVLRVDHKRSGVALHTVI